MIMQAIIESVNTDGTCYVNIPNLTNVKQHTNPTSGYLAKFSTLPNCVPNVLPGDRVYVAFLNNNVGNPIIIGHMYFKNPDLSAQTDSTVSVKFSDLETTQHTYLAADTSIGEVSAQEISYLKGLNSNLQAQLRSLQERVFYLEQLHGSHKDTTLPEVGDDKPPSVVV